MPVGALWLAHREDGFERASESLLRGMGIPVERLSPADVSERWPQIGRRRPGLRDLRTRGRPVDGPTGRRRGGPPVRRRGWPGRARLGATRAAPTVAGSSRSRPTRACIRGDQFVFAAGRGCRGCFPGCSDDLIRVTKQDVIFVGTPAGDGRFEADRLPCWVDYDAAFYGIPAIDGRGMKIGPDRYGPVFDPSHGERIVDPESVRLARRYLAAPVPRDWPTRRSSRPGSASTRRRPDTHFIIDRHPDFDNCWLVGGGSGHGFKHGPVIGDLVVRLLTGEPRAPDEVRFELGHARAARAEPADRGGRDGRGLVGLVVGRRTPNQGSLSPRAAPSGSARPARPGTRAGCTAHRDRATAGRSAG